MPEKREQEQPERVRWFYCWPWDRPVRGYANCVWRITDEVVPVMRIACCQSCFKSPSGGCNKKGGPEAAVWW